MTGILAHSGEYRIEHQFEDASLVWSGGAIFIGDHVGDPTCALINEAEGWCVTGGEGLVICHFKEAFPKSPELSDSNTPTLMDVWRRDNPPPLGKYWAVENIWLLSEGVVRVVADPLGDHAGLYDVNIRALTWRRI